jgi:hypothetical protein
MQNAKVYSSGLDVCTAATAYILRLLIKTGDGEQINLNNLYSTALNTVYRTYNLCTIIDMNAAHGITRR